MIFSLDTETCGLDFYHGSKPFFVTMCYPDGNQAYWEWNVDPVTRQPTIPPEDIQEIQNLVNQAERIVFHNSKFDITALRTIGINVPWEKVEDTLVMSHCLNSILSHDLTSLGIQYLGRDISHYEKKLQVEVNNCRRYARSHYPSWRIAEEGMKDLPSAKNELWRNDLWLPKTLDVFEERSPESTTLADYANADTAVTIALYSVMLKELRSAKLEKAYHARREVLPALHRMEQRGISTVPASITKQLDEFKKQSCYYSELCTGIAEGYGYNLDLPKGNRNRSLTTFVFDYLKLPVIKKSEKTGEPSLDSDTIEEYTLTTRKGSKQRLFIESFSKRNECDKALSMLESYVKFITTDGYTINPSFNLTGTCTTRLSSSKPNGQQVSKKPGANLRKSFGPKPGRVWYSLDAQNIELRIPAYECDEKDLVAIFDKPKDPPYYGGYHLLIFDVLHPEIFKKLGKHVKEPESEGGYGSTLYQAVKNGNFARQYGAQKRKVDMTYGVDGGYEKVMSRFPKIDRLNKYHVAYADKHGYVETIFDTSVGTSYRIMTERTEFGKVSPTVPFCYHVSGTAGWWMNRAIVKVDEQMEEWRQTEGFDGYVVLTVHDELVLDFPAATNEQEEQNNTNKVQTVRKLMESCGNGISIPTPVSAEKHIENWNSGISL